MYPLQDANYDQAQQILEVLSTLNYRTGELQPYLQQVALGLSSLIRLDWSVVTLCHGSEERIMASSVPCVDVDAVYQLHGTLTQTVVTTGSVLAIDNALAHPELGAPPEGYCAYLGVPMTTSMGETIGTICSFSVIPRSFTTAEVRTAELFAERAVAAIENYRLYQQLLHFNESLETEIAQRTEELRLAQSRLIEKERLAAIGEFAAMIVHELRNPVTTILMGLTALQREPLGDRNQSRIQLALDETEHLQSLVQEILQHSKPQSLKMVRLEVNQFFASIRERLENIPERCDRNLVLESAPTDFYISGDSEKLRQVMVNLVRNAFEAIAPAETVTCRIRSHSPDSVCLQVQNGGEPIAPEILPQLNRPFCSTKIGGTGLGLAVVRQIVVAHGGNLRIESSAETGTLVTVCLPLAL